jgi:hypothetical protein
MGARMARLALELQKGVPRRQDLAFLPLAIMAVLFVNRIGLVCPSESKPI